MYRVDQLQLISYFELKYYTHERNEMFKNITWKEWVGLAWVLATILYSLFGFILLRDVDIIISSIIESLLIASFFFTGYWILKGNKVIKFICSFIFLLFIILSVSAYISIGRMESEGESSKEDIGVVLE